MAPEVGKEDDHEYGNGEDTKVGQGEGAVHSK